MNNQPGELLREGERLERRIIRAGRLNGDRRRQIGIIYRLADSYGNRVFPHSFCSGMAGSPAGCVTGACCACRPDVFAYEKELLDRLPKRLANLGHHCPFFNRAKRNCGIYTLRPFACRIYYNHEMSHYYCQNPAEETIRLLESLKRHLEEILGSYLGGYLPGLNEK